MNQTHFLCNPNMQYLTLVDENIYNGLNRATKNVEWNCRVLTFLWTS